MNNVPGAERKDTWGSAFEAETNQAGEGNKWKGKHTVGGQGTDGFRIRGEKHPGGERKGKERQKEDGRTRYMGLRVRGGKNKAGGEKERKGNAKRRREDKVLGGQRSKRINPGGKRKGY